MANWPGQSEPESLRPRQQSGDCLSGILTDTGQFLFPLIPSVGSFHPPVGLANLPPEALPDTMQEWTLASDLPPVEIIESYADSLDIDVTGAESPLGSEEGSNLTSRDAADPSEMRYWQTQNGLQLAAMREQVRIKLIRAGADDLAEPLAECGTYAMTAVCVGCRAKRTYYNRCERTYCPACQPRIAKERQNYLQWWSARLLQPKHVVLTVRNEAVITQGWIKSVKESFARLRRSKFAAGWKAGCYSVEVTNEGKGWHLHLHCLIEARWIDVRQLEVEWAKRVGQEMAVVRVYDARESNYVREVAKYIVKGTTLACLSPEDLRSYVLATTGVKNFGTFGELRGLREEFVAFRKSRLETRPICPCGCKTFRVLDHLQLSEWEATGRFPTHHRY